MAADFLKLFAAISDKKGPTLANGTPNCVSTIALLAGITPVNPTTKVCSTIVLQPNAVKRLHNSACCSRLTCMHLGRSRSEVKPTSTMCTVILGSLRLWLARAAKSGCTFCSRTISGREQPSSCRGAGKRASGKLRYRSWHSASTNMAQLPSMPALISSAMALTTKPWRAHIWFLIERWAHCPSRWLIVSLGALQRAQDSGRFLSGYHLATLARVGSVPIRTCNAMDLMRSVI